MSMTDIVSSGARVPAADDHWTPTLVSLGLPAFVAVETRYSAYPEVVGLLREMALFISCKKPRRRKMNHDFKDENLFDMVGRCAMHDGADAEQISAGLHGLDFLTRASEFDDNTRARLEGAITEGEMRVILLNQLEASRKSRGQLIKEAVEGVKHLQLVVKSIQHRMKYPPMTAIEYIEAWRKQ